MEGRYASRLKQEGYHFINITARGLGDPEAYLTKVHDARPLMRARHKAEREDGISTEPGVARKKEIENASPELKAINKKFCAAHGISSLVNLFGFWGLFAHFFYLAGRLSL